MPILANPSPPRVFSCPVGTPFLQTFVRAFLSGALVPGFSVSPDDPLALGSATIHVPTRRAARSLASAFVDELGGRSALLPDIRVLGDEAGDEFDMALAGGLADHDSIEPLDRLLLLAQLVDHWRRSTVTGPGASASRAEALWLARDLAALMDEMEREEADWISMQELAPDDLAAWWQMTLNFLQIVTTAWPAILKERNLVNPEIRRRRAIDRMISDLEANPPSGPVIVAGSTGSVPSTARLIKAIANLEQGAVVLPGLDRTMDDESYRSLTAEGSAANPGHPQYGLAALLRKIGIDRSEVKEIAQALPVIAERNAWVSHALRPTETTDDWRELVASQSPARLSEAFSDVTLVEAANERQEALAIAVALRSAIEEHGHYAALVTPDRAMARRVSSELKRFGIMADDSGGFPLMQSPPGTLMRLMIDAALHPGDPSLMLALAKHPLAQFGMERQLTLQAIRVLERACLRGGPGKADFRSLLSALGEAPDDDGKTGRSRRHTPPWRSSIDAAQLQSARMLVLRMEAAMEPLTAIRAPAPVSLWTAATTLALERAARGPAGGTGAFYKADAGEHMAKCLRRVIQTDGAGFVLTPGEWQAAIVPILAGETVRPRAGGHPRVAIWGTLEARLQPVDTLILGGLNDGTWPNKAGNDLFLSRPMRAVVSLEPPERRIGLAAHDFQMAMGARKVVLTRSVRSGDAPTSPSRWLLRLLTVAGAAEPAMRDRGKALLNAGQGLDRDELLAPAPRPCPRPPLDKRPDRFSVTEIERLRRDPYAVYAHRVLRLHPMDPLMGPPDHRERGNLFHAILADFVAMAIDPGHRQARDQMAELADRHFESADLPAEIAVLWRPRFAAIADAFLAWEQTRKQDLVQSHVEVYGKMDLADTGVVLSGIADRIDIRKDASLEIIDYKGVLPSAKQARTLLAPQLALEGAMVRRGAFGDIPDMPIASLKYVRLKPDDPLKVDRIEGKRAGRGGISEDIGADELSTEAWSRVMELIQHYRDPQSGYLSRALAVKDSLSEPYDHLARYHEWGTVEGDEE